MHYRHGYCARTTGASVTSARGSDLLQVRDDRSGRRVTVEVTPGRCKAGRFGVHPDLGWGHVPEHHHPRGLEPVATPEEIEAAARQYVRKVSGVQKTSAETEKAFERAVAQVTKATTALIATLPPRKQPPPTAPAAPDRRQEGGRSDRRGVLTWARP